MPAWIYQLTDPFQIGEGRKLSDITDGLSKTALASEVISGKHDEQIAGTVESDDRGLWAWHIMGASSYTHRNTPNSGVGDAMWANPSQDIECVHSEQMPCDNTHGTSMDEFQAAARSQHPGGVQVVFADGHVNFMSDTIDVTLWQCLGAINDGWTVSDSNDGEL